MALMQNVRSPEVCLPYEKATLFHSFFLSTSHTVLHLILFLSLSSLHAQHPSLKWV